ncbi:MAG: AAA family ATPase [Alphaproteobacteria bacterium]|nr:AAA family ATPase [Alphaproteobacteria bacterium]
MALKKNKSYNFPEPMANSELTGHSGTIAAFTDAFARIAEYPLHPVWMLAGVRGIGKATLAYHIARYVFKNTGSKNPNPDDSLALFENTDQTNQQSVISNMQPFSLPTDDPVFQKMIQGGFGDFFIIDMAHNTDKDGRPKTDGKSISVHTVRAMIEKMQMSSMEGAWRVVIIDSLDELTVAAANAMLKLLEEPPAQTLFILVSHSLANTLPTIRSRARVEKMQPLSISQLRELFYKFIPDEDASPALLKLANGSFGRIAELKKNGGDALYERLLPLCADSRANAADVMALAAQIAKEPALHGIILDAAAHFGLADLYPLVTREITAINALHLEPEIAIFKLIMEIRKNVISCS